MKILYVSYPMLEVSDASCGGAEQMLWTVEHEMARHGHQTAVAACSGSQVAGELISTGEAPTATDAFEMRAEEHCRAVIEAVQTRKFDVVHDKSGFFWQQAREINTPVLATLHLPRSFYSKKLFRDLSSNVHFNCVSESQARSFEDLPNRLGVVPNGIALDRFKFEPTKKDYVLWIGRICPEKAPHLAIDAAERAGTKLVMVGRVYPFSWHQQYFDEEVRPRLVRAGEQVHWIERPSFEEKVDLLAGARALLLPTLAPETSSLVSMEAMASGTPVVAFGNGALPEIVESGLTGYLVKDIREMADAIVDVNRLWPDDARRVAEERFSAVAMAKGYERTYGAMLRDGLSIAA